MPRDFYVSPITGSDSNVGSESAPFFTVPHALSVQDNGDRIILEDGDHLIPGPLVIANRNQGQLRARNRNAARLVFESFVGGISGNNSFLALRDCLYYCVDGVNLVPPEVADISLILGAPPTFPNLSVLEIRGGRGNLIRDTVVESFEVAAGDFQIYIGIHILSAPHTKLRNVEVQEVRSRFGTAGFVWGIRSDTHTTLENVQVHNLYAFNGGVVGVNFSSPTGQALRVNGATVLDLLSETEDGVTTAGSAAYRIERRTAGSSDQADALLRNVRAYRIEHLSESTGSTLRGSGIEIDFAGRVDINGYVAYRCVDGIRVVEMRGVPKWDNLTFHRCTAAVRSEPEVLDPGIQTAKAVVRNISISKCGAGFVDAGVRGQTFFDVDFVNAFEVAPLVQIENPPAAGIQFGPRLRSRNPRFVEPTDRALNFGLELISPLVNKGGGI